MVIHGFNHIIEHSLGFIKDDYTELWVVVVKIAEENPQFSFQN
jgi:hypothetical protein